MIANRKKERQETFAWYKIDAMMIEISFFPCSSLSLSLLLYVYAQEWNIHNKKKTMCDRLPLSLFFWSFSLSLSSLPSLVLHLWSVANRRWQKMPISSSKERERERKKNPRLVFANDWSGIDRIVQFLDK